MEYKVSEKITGFFVVLLKNGMSFKVSYSRGHINLSPPSNRNFVGGYSTCITSLL